MSNSPEGAYVGIDLGTTQSVIAHLSPQNVAMTISNRDGEPLTPSALYLDGNHAVVGKAAKKAIAEYPDKVATVVKRDMGKREYARMLDGRRFRPETLSAIILRKLKQDAERRIGPIAGAVITVPAFFDDARRKATEDAGRIAGLNVLKIINEPTAAAIAFMCEGRLNPGALTPVHFNGQQETVLVYDLGGGTFDVTIVTLTDNTFRAIATGGQVDLGGREWDEKLLDYMGEQFAARHGINPLACPNPAKPPPERIAAQLTAEFAKEQLSVLPTAPLKLTQHGLAWSESISRSDFEAMTADLLTHTQLMTDHVRNAAGLNWSDVGRVLLVGGSTRMPMIKEMLNNLTASTPDDCLDPDQAVARGAAIYAAMQAHNNAPQVSIVNVNSHSLGIQAIRPNGQVINSILIPRNSPLPCQKSRLFKAGVAQNGQIIVKVLEGEAEDAAACIPLGDCLISDLPPNLRRDSKIQVQLKIAENGRVDVNALETEGGTYASVEVRRKTGLTDADVAREAAFVQALTIV